MAEIRTLQQLGQSYDPDTRAFAVEFLTVLPEADIAEEMWERMVEGFLARDEEDVRTAEIRAIQELRMTIHAAQRARRVPRVPSQGDPRSRDSSI